MNSIAPSENARGLCRRFPNLHLPPNPPPCFGDYDEDEDNIIQNADGQYRVKALTEIADFNEVIGTSLSDEEFSTIGGLVVNQFGHLPKRNEEITFSRRALRQHRICPGSETTGPRGNLAYRCQGPQPG